MFSPKSPPIGDVLSGEVRSPPPLMDSSSCFSYLQDRQKNRNEEAGEIPSTAVVVTRDFFPLTPDWEGSLGSRELGDPRQEIVPAQPFEFEEGEERRNGVSTELGLLFDPYHIKKRLTKSDAGHQSRLLIPRVLVMNHVLPYMSEELVNHVQSGVGADVVVWDADTRSEHPLVFGFWASSGSYILKGCWTKEFLQRRELAAGDEIGIYWDPIVSRFHFSLLGKAN